MLGCFWSDCFLEYVWDFARLYHTHTHTTTYNNNCFYSFVFLGGETKREGKKRDLVFSWLTRFFFLFIPVSLCVRMCVRELAVYIRLIHHRP